MQLNFDLNFFYLDYIFLNSWVKIFEFFFQKFQNWKLNSKFQDQKVLDRAFNNIIQKKLSIPSKILMLSKIVFVPKIKNKP